MAEGLCHLLQAIAMSPGRSYAARVSGHAAEGQVVVQNHWDERYGAKDDQEPKDRSPTKGGCENTA
jgi:hypothetical protein